MLKRLATLVALTFLASAAFAQQEHHHMTDDDFRALAASLSSHGPVVLEPALAIVPTATKSFTITATATSLNSGYSFSVSPTPFTVNQGDTVQLTFTVPSTDKSQLAMHGLLMDTYFDGFTSGSQQPFDVNRGSSVTKTFVVGTAGTFGFVCNVSNCGPGHSSMQGTFKVNPQSNPAPTISSLSPTSGPAAGGTTVTISGTNFGSGATVSFGGTAGTSVNVVSSTSITVVAPAHVAGSVSVNVANADNQSATLSNGYQYVAGISPPTLTTASPSTGPNSGNTLVTLTGTNFQTGAAVTFGSVPATSVTVVNATTITVRTPVGPDNAQVGQSIAVQVTNPDTGSVSAPIFFYSVPALTVTSLDLPAGPPAGGNVVTILGTGFTTAVSSSISFGGVAATNVQVLDAITLKVTVPAHALGAVNVVVTMGGSSTTATNGYVYSNPPSKRRAAKH